MAPRWVTACAWPCMHKCYCSQAWHRAWKGRVLHADPPHRILNLQDAHLCSADARCVLLCHWHAGVWEEVVIDRHTNVTSPVSCGVVYATTVHVTSTAASGSHTPATASSHTAAVKHTEQIDSVVGHRAATDILTGTEDGTASSGSSESQQWRNHTGPLYDTTNHPWVAVSIYADTIAGAVFSP